MARHTYLLFSLVVAGSSLAQDCTGWVERMPASHPDMPGNPPIAFDAERGRTVAFVPIGEPNLRETWEWDGTDWQLCSTTGPNVRFASELVYDSVRHVCVLFGGARSGGYSSETWEWDGSVWTLREPMNSPPERAEHSMTFDSNRGVTVVYGGSDDQEHLHDTWEYDGEDWSLRSEEGPSVGSQVAMTFNAAAGNTVLYGDAYTWVWDGSVWTLLNVNPPQPIPRHRHSMAYDSDNGVVVLFGGVNAVQDLNDTWEWNNAKWSLRASADKPLARREAGLAYDSIRHVMVLFGGNRGGPALNDTWEFVCTPPCYADLDGNGALDLFDYLEFVNLFNAASPKADCDASGALDLFDFLCFVNDFNTGCP